MTREKGKTMTKWSKDAQDKAAEMLREHFPAGSKVTTITRHVSRSGMSRTISVLAADADGSVQDVSWMVARVIGWPLDDQRGGVKVGGAGMDMGFHLVYTLSRHLYPNGHPCTGWTYTEKRGNGRQVLGCNSNDHANGDRTYRRGKTHRDGGYALRQAWA